MNRLFYPWTRVAQRHDHCLSIHLDGNYLYSPSYYSSFYCLTKRFFASSVAQDWTNLSLVMPHLPLALPTWLHTLNFVTLSNIWGNGPWVPIPFVRSTAPGDRPMVRYEAHLVGSSFVFPSEWVRLDTWSTIRAFWLVFVGIGSASLLQLCLLIFDQPQRASPVIDILISFSYRSSLLSSFLEC